MNTTKKFDTSWYEKFFRVNPRQRNFRPNTASSLPETTVFTAKAKDVPGDKQETTNNK